MTDDVTCHRLEAELESVLVAGRGDARLRSLIAELPRPGRAGRSPSDLDAWLDDHRGPGWRVVGRDTVPGRRGRLLFERDGSWALATTWCSPDTNQALAMALDLLPAPPRPWPPPTGEFPTGVVGEELARQGLVGLFLASGSATGTTSCFTAGTTTIGQTMVPAPDHPIRAGSVTKLVTTLAVFALERQGGCRIDDPISAHVRSVEVKEPTDGRTATIRHLLTHTGGLERREDGAVVRMAAAGASRRYSNLGFELLATMIEDCTSQSFTTWVQREVLAPAEMVGSRIDPSGAEISGHGVGFGLAWTSPVEALPAGSRGLVTTGSDLVRLGSAVLDRPEMWRPHRAVAGAEDGLGVLLGPFNGRPVAFHDGGVRDAFKTLVVVDSDQGVVLVGWASCHPADLWTVAERLDSVTAGLVGQR